MDTLKDKVPKTNWPDLVFMAAGDDEEFQEVKITTLKSHYLDTVFDLAWKQINDSDDVHLEETLMHRANEIMDSGNISVREYVKVNGKYQVEICIDRETITDAIVEEALDLLVEIGIEPRTCIEFGNSRTYDSQGI